MPNIGANAQLRTSALEPKTLRAPWMSVPTAGKGGFHIVDAGEMFAGVFDLQKFELSAHAVQLHGKILGLERDLKNLPQITDALAAECENRDFLLGIVRRSEEGEPLHVIPMEMRERDDQPALRMPDARHAPP